jgi:hypothetical protein
MMRLWQIKPPGPKNLFSDPAFINLRETCQRLYGSAGTKGAVSFALSNALHAFGLPSGLAPCDAHLVQAPEVAAVLLDAAFRATRSEKIHLCPLDLASDLPSLQFGPNSIRKLSEAELKAIVDPKHLKRINPEWTFDAKRFSEFTWLIVREDVAIDREAGARAVPALFINLGEDLGRIDPHPGQFPRAVEAALLAVLICPWEDWVEMPQVDWRAFRIPWVYSLDRDVFIRPAAPFSPDTLSWEPYVHTDYDGEDIEVEKPTSLPLKSAASSASNWLNDKVWFDLELVTKSPLFETPISHFLIRAFATEGIDAFLAHITVVEAALGLQIDHDSHKRRKLLNQNSQGATFRVAKRLSGLLGSKADGDAFQRLFKERSKYLHGRPMNSISTSERILARCLARRVVEALGKAALAMPAPTSREIYLDGLLDAGLRLGP